jgi:hypothetical protein
MNRLNKKNWRILVACVLLVAVLICAVACTNNANTTSMQNTPAPVGDNTAVGQTEAPALTAIPSETEEPTAEAEPTATPLPDGWIIDPKGIIPVDVEIVVLGLYAFDSIQTQSSCICKEDGRYFYRWYIKGSGIYYAREVPETMVGSVQEEEPLTTILFLVTETESGFNVFCYKNDIGKKMCVTGAQEVVHHNLWVYALMDDHTLIMYDFYRDYYFLYKNEDAVITIIRNDIGEVYFLLDGEDVGDVDLIADSEECPLE